MITAGIVAGMIVLVGLLMLVGAFYYVAKRRFTHVIQSFITPSTPGGASPFALLCQSIASVFGTAISASLKATFMGIESSEAKAVNKQRAESVIAGSPMMAALVAGFPNLAKKFAGNPAFAALADLAIRKVTSAPNQQGTESDNHRAGPAVKFRF